MATTDPDPSMPTPTAAVVQTPPPIRLHAKEGLLGEGKIHRFEIPSAAGMTARKVMEVARGVPALSRRPLGVAVNGRRLEPAELDQQLPDGAEVLVASPQHGAELGYFLLQALISAVVGVAINYLVSLLLPKPKPAGLPQDRGDDSSATYAWDGITTSYGQGQPVPFGYGRHAVGGQVIYSEVADYSSSPGVSGEYLRILLALCDGPIHRVGDLIAGEQNGLGLATPLPATIKVNQLELLGSTQGVLAWIRAGNLNQTPIPSPFSGAAATFTVGFQLQAAYSEAFFALLGVEDISAVYVIVSFPNGLFEQDATGSVTGAQWPWLLQWRPVGESTWRLLAQSAPGAYYYRPAGGILGIYGALPAGTLLPIELRLQRLGQTVIPSGQVSDLGVWRQVTAYSAYQFAYPGVAILGLELRADARLQGAQPQLQVTCDLLKIRVWDESLGWSEPCWDVPAAPFNWMQHAPGRNPAWHALHLLLDDVVGLGRWFKEADVDLEAARRWSLFCDTEPNPSDPWGEPSFTFDGVFDSPRPAWERLLAICAAGRCTPVMLGRRISFVYQYRDAHADSLVSVPAKAPVQLFTSTNIEGLSINWLPKSNRSTVIQYQFLNEAKAYAQDVIPVEDPEGTLNEENNPLADRWQHEVTQLYGVTRESQLLREGVFTHRLQRLVTHEILFRTGPWSLGASIGDVILVENEVLRPFGADVPWSCAIEQAQTSHDKMIVGHVITGTGLRVVFRDLEGAPRQVDITALTALAGGRTELTLATPESWIAGAPAVVGKVAKLTRPYLIVGIGLTQDVKREVRAIDWQPSIFDPIGPEFFSEPPTEPAAVPEASEPEVFVQSLRSGGHVVSWSSLSGGNFRRARVWASRDDVEAWLLLGESNTGALETKALAALQSYRLAVSVDVGGGVFRPPEDLTGTTVTAPEFPSITMPPVRALTIEEKAGGLLFRWPAQGQWDLHYYELRAGANWVTAKPIYTGQIAEVFIPEPPMASVFQVAARSISGVYGAPASASPPVPWAPECKVAYAERDELDTTPTGTLDGLDYDSGMKVLRFAPDSNVEASYTAPEIDGGYVAPWHWQVDLDYTLFDDGTCGEETGTCGDGEAIWSTCACRPPSPARPGLAVDDGLIGDDDGLCGDDSPFETVSGGLGEVGSLATVVLESRFHDGAAWSDWDTHVDGERVSQKIQTRVRLERTSVPLNVEVTRLAAKGLL